MAAVPPLAWAVLGSAAIGAGTAYATRPKTPKPPEVPNQNNAQNAAQEQADALRQRRGVLANIYAGSGSTQAQSGKTALGT